MKRKTDENRFPAEALASGVTEYVLLLLLFVRHTAGWRSAAANNSYRSASAKNGCQHVHTHYVRHVPHIFSISCCAGCT
jgi:hypothetical protein